MRDQETPAVLAESDAHAGRSFTKRRLRLSRSWYRWVVLVGAAVLLVSLGFLWRAANAAPDWWQPAAALSPDAPQRAGALERGATRAIYELREQPEAPWTVSITQHDANAWLTHRLHPWLESRGVVWTGHDPSKPTDPLEPRVRFELGTVRIALSAGGRVMGFASKPAVEDGAIVLRETALLLGSMELKGSIGSVAAKRVWDRLLADLAPDERESLGAALTGRGGPIVRDPVLRLEDGRSVRVVAIDVLEGELRLTCMTSRAETE